MTQKTSADAAMARYFATIQTAIAARDVAITKAQADFVAAEKAAWDECQQATRLSKKAHGD